MTDLLPSSPQILDVAAVAMAMAALTGLGGMAGRHRLAEADLVVGWGAAVMVVIGGALVGLAPAATVWGVVAAGFAWLARGLAVGHRPAILPMLMLVVPLLVLVGGMPPSQWDEFSQWLYSGRYLFDTGAFPTKSGPPFLGTFAAYPFGNVLPTLLASKLAGHFIDNAGIVANTMLLVGFALLLARLLAEGAGREPHGPIGWGLSALALLFATALHPTFVPKIVFTAYADMATAVALAFLGILTWRVIAAIEAGEGVRGRVLAGQAGLAAALLVQLKQSNLVLLVLVVIAAIVLAARLRLFRRESAVALVLVLGPAFVVHLLWRQHVALNAPGAEFAVRPMGQWAIDILPDIVFRMGLVASNKGGHFSLLIGLGVLGIRGLVRARTPFDHLAAIAAMVGLGYNAFLLFAYVAAFDRGEASTAASYWRYNIHVGSLLWATALFGLAQAWARWIEPLRLGWRRPAVALAVILAVAGPWATLRYIRFDREADKDQVRHMAVDMLAVVPPGARLAVVDPMDGGFYVLQMRYLMHHRTGDALRLYQSFPHPFTTETVVKALDQFGADHAWVRSHNEAVRSAFGLALTDDAFYLLRREGAGWVTARTWPREGS